MTLRNLPPRLWLGLALIVVPGLLLVALEVYVAGIKAPALQRSRELVAHTFEVIGAAEALRSAVKDAERAQRGYLVTSDRAYLAPFNKGVDEAPQHLVTLASLSADNPAQQRRVPELERHLGDKLKEMRRTLEVHDRQGVKVARDIVLTNAGLESMQAIDRIVEAVIAAEQDLLVQRTAMAAQEERETATAAIVSSVLALMAMLLGGAVVLLAFRDLLRAEAARRESDRRLAQQQQHLAQYQKMEAVGQLTGGIAHDFNNLVHIIKNALEIARRKLKPGDAEVLPYLDMAGRNADRAASVTQRLLAFSRRQVLDPRPIDPNDLLAEVTLLLGRALGEGIAVETVIGAGAWWTSADPHQLETALLNLALNARDAMPEGGKLTIEVANAYLDETYAAAHAEVKAGQYVMIAVSDTGSGMNREVAAQAFEPFFTTKEIGRGTGLGLSQVYGFVKQSNGHAEIHSEPGQGTTVKIYLPRLYEVPESDARLDAQKPAPLPPAEPRHGSILVVEDENDVRAFTVEVLQGLGYRVVSAPDAPSALRVLEKETVDLLFTDVGLPGMNGRQLADEARRRWPALKLLFTTGYTRNAIIHHGRLDPGVELMPKPYTQSSLAEKVRRVLARA